MASQRPWRHLKNFLEPVAPFSQSISPCRPTATHSGLGQSIFVSISPAATSSVATVDISSVATEDFSLQQRRCLLLQEKRCLLLQEKRCLLLQQEISLLLQQKTSLGGTRLQPAVAGRGVSRSNLEDPGNIGNQNRQNPYIASSVWGMTRAYSSEGLPIK